MTFELSAEQQAVRDQARAFAAERVQSLAAEIDRTASIPVDLARQAAELIAGDDLVTMVVALEEIAAASGSLAASAAAGATRGASHTLPGLRGAPLPADSPRSQLSLAAIGLGLGRAARDASLAQIRDATAHPGGEEKPHWVIADAASELEAARMLTLAAAQAIGEGNAQTAVALARLATAAAACSAVDAALRVAGPDGYREGAVLERLSRDVRAVTLVLGTEEHHRAKAAEGLLPQ